MTNMFNLDALCKEQKAALVKQEWLLCRAKFYNILKTSKSLDN